ncbi:helix-turn-helix transcriptional regulator [Cellulophaga sp. E16_2]|uniref:helix-turn-helix domain-containing protein n=1 Tax=Cellulophaga sp. E16_2 TaxID=2789297 RepID=UPI001A90EEA1|nr:AraC family transcriptional regulator [Cellulophaga sp. E16_2]MBO0590100.1 helix-turn-helix transcriptional regulator [Cellulophaga sp. E16_2]
MHSKALLIIGSFFILSFLNNSNLYSAQTPRPSIIETYTLDSNLKNSSIVFKEKSILQKYSNINSQSKVIFKKPNKNIQKNILNWIFILNALLGLIISLKISFKALKKDCTSIYLGVFLAGVSLMLLELSLIWCESINYNPTITFFRVQLYFWIPSLFLYMKSKIITLTKTTREEIALHYFVPILFSLIYCINFIINEKLIVIIINSVTLKSIQLGIYLLLLIYSGIKYRSHICAINRKLLVSIVLFIITLFIIMITRAFYENNQIINSLIIYLAAILFSTLINIISAILFLKPEVIFKVQIKKILKKEKYKNSGLTNDMILTLKEQLESLLTIEKVYLDNNLTLEELSKRLNTDRYSLSQTINQEFGKNFYELVNDYRIQEAIHIIQNTEKKILITELIYESGFNNKVSFYKAFKKRHLKTPLEYQKSVKKSLEI